MRKRKTWKHNPHQFHCVVIFCLMIVSLCHKYLPPPDSVLCSIQCLYHCPVQDWCGLLGLSLGDSVPIKNIYGDLKIILLCAPAFCYLKQLQNKFLDLSLKSTTQYRDFELDVGYQTYYKFWSLPKYTSATTYVSAIDRAIIFKTVTFLSRVAPIVAPVFAPQMSRWSSSCSSPGCVKSHAIFASVVASLVAFAYAFAFVCFVSCYKLGQWIKR